MAWIESHQTLKEHPKLYDLMAKLQISRAQAVGHLHLLWWWCVDYATEGDLTGKNDEQISRAGEWTGEPRLFVNALVECGFIDRGDGVLTVHDWLDFCGRLVEKRLERRGVRTMDGERRPKVAERRPTLPTQPTNHDPPDGGADEFWNSYPQKGRSRTSKAKVRAAWKAEKCEPIKDSVMAGLRKWVASDDWTREGGQFVPSAARFLRERRWENPPESVLDDEDERYNREIGPKVDALIAEMEVPI